MKQILCLLLLAVFITSGCTTVTPSGGLTPMPSGRDLSDEVLKEAITTYLKNRQAPPNSEYDFVRTDLNNDGARDGIVLFKLPHTYWCGWDGCGMVVFKAGSKNFSPITTIRNVRGPIYTSAKLSNSWHDIIIRVSGANMPDKNIVLKYNGRSYPKSPLVAPSLDVPLNTVKTATYFR